MKTTKEKRLAAYKTVLSIIEERHNRYGLIENYLCFMLPFAYRGEDNNDMKVYINDDIVIYINTVKDFPELENYMTYRLKGRVREFDDLAYNKLYVLKYNELIGTLPNCKVYATDKWRIKVLKEIIASMENK